MIVYSPINGEVLQSAIKFFPKTGFIMTQLGGDPPPILSAIRNDLSKQLADYSFTEKDASSLLTGKDFLEKIWKIILGVPLGIAILTEGMSIQTISNVFYELGIMDSLGKETLIIKTKEYVIPSDFKRTEYVNYDERFSLNFQKFYQNLKDREDYYWDMSEWMQANPAHSIDYIKRAFLLNPKKQYIEEAERIFKASRNKIDESSLFHIQNFIKRGKTLAR